MSAPLRSTRPQPGSSDPRAWIFLVVKFAFTGAITAVSLAYLVKIARAGGERHVSMVLIAMPFAAAVVALVVSLALTPVPDWRAMIFGRHWLPCVACIPLNAILPFAAVIFAMRQFASPTHLARAGAFAGLTAGGISAFVYALHCTDDSLPFVALWYGLTIAPLRSRGRLPGAAAAALVRLTRRKLALAISAP